MVGKILEAWVANCENSARINRLGGLEGGERAGKVKTQKFQHGDLVRIAKDLGAFMEHFECDQEAIVDYSYTGRYDGNDAESYGLILCKDGNQVSWYHGHQLTFIRHVGEAGKAEIRAARKNREKQETDIEWILQNWMAIRDKVTGATVC